MIDIHEQCGIITKSENGTVVDRVNTAAKASEATPDSVQEQITILEQERMRLTPLAAREHWVALGFASLAGVVFLGAVTISVLGTIQQTIVTVAASIIPGFLSRIFFSREAIIEKRIAAISADLAESGRIRKRLLLLQETLKILPKQYRPAFVEEFKKKLFRSQ